MEPCGAAGLSIVVSLEWIQFQPDPHDFVDLRIFGTEFPDPLYLINQIREIINQISITEFSVQYCKNCCGIGVPIWRNVGVLSMKNCPPAVG